MSVLAVVGMAREARAVSRPGVLTLMGAGQAERLAAELERLTYSGFGGSEAGATALRPRAVISLGIAGGLDPALAPGTAIVASAVIDGERRWVTDPPWSERLLADWPGAREGVLAGRDAPVATREGKAALARETGAVAVDMESHIAARAAARARLPFAAVRVVCDPADHALPPAAVAGFRADGTEDVAAVLRALARDPRQLPALIRTGRQAGTAFRALVHGLQGLAGQLAFPG